MIADPFRHLLLLLAIVALVACGRAPPAPGEVAEKNPAKLPLENELGVLLPSAYAGKTTERPRAAWFDEFERGTGCRLSLSTADDDREFVDKAQRDAVDLIIADGIVGLQLIQGGAAQPLDTRRVPPLSGVDPRFADLPWMSQFGVRYAIPFQAGVHVLMYDPTVFPEHVTSWSLLYEAQTLPDGKPNAGRVQSSVGAIGIADAALFLRTQRPSLAIADPFELDEKQFAAALDALRQQRPLLHSIWRYGEDKALRDFRQGAVVAMSASVRQFDRLRDEGASVAMRLPAEGSTGWLHASLLKTGARHPNCAYAFMAWSLKPRIQAQLSATASTLPVVASVCRDARLLDPARCAELGADALDRVHFAHLPTARCRDRASRVPYSRWFAEFESLNGDAP